MNLITKLPGPLLIFFGAFSLSFGGLIVKSFEGSTLWQILFWRSVFFIIVVLIFLIISYKQNFISAFYKSGIPGLIGGIILACGFSGYVFAMYNTTVANTNFIIQTQTLFLAIFGPSNLIPILSESFVILKLSLKNLFCEDSEK